MKRTMIRSFQILTTYFNQISLISSEETLNECNSDNKELEIDKLYTE